MPPKKRHGGGRKTTARKPAARKVKGTARPGSMVTRKVSRGPGKGDTVKFTANSASAAQPGKLKPRRVVKDVKPFKTQKTLARGKAPKKRKR